jgi:hypothetical protein
MFSEKLQQSGGPEAIGDNHFGRLNTGPDNSPNQAIEIHGMMP